MWRALGVASYEGHELTGVCPFPRLSVVSVTQQERAANPAIPSAWYVLEQTNIDDLVIWQDASGAVYQAMPGACAGENQHNDGGVYRAKR